MLKRAATPILLTPCYCNYDLGSNWTPLDAMNGEHGAQPAQAASYGLAWTSQAS